MIEALVKLLVSTGMLSAGPPTVAMEGGEGKMARRGVARSSVLVTEAYAGNVVGSDPHKHTVTTTVVDGTRRQDP